MNYTPPWWLRNGHLQSVYPSVFRSLNDSFFTRDKIDTPDGDFLELDWARQGNDRLVILTHGLEGHSRRPYILGMAQAALDNQWDVLAWNFRSCSGTPNRKLNSYHSGQTHDLEQIITTASEQNYKEIALIGFSIGGNKTLLYLGREQHTKPSTLVGAVTFSVPLDLEATSAELAKPQNRIYMLNFLKSFKEKFEQKNKLFDNAINLKRYHRIKTFKEFDSRFTAPMNGFDSAEAYWRASSSLFQLNNIEHPTLLVNALDDPFLTPECFPYELARKHAYLQFQATKYGGHVGFMSGTRNSSYWSEEKAFHFLNKLSQL